MKWIWKLQCGHTGTVDICAFLDEEPHNFVVTVNRGHMQGSSVLVAYSGDVNEVDLQLSAYTDR
jgi:hypothetical protein